MNAHDLEELFHAARSRDPGERTEFLRAACGEDGAALSAVESLLESSDTPNDFLETPAAEWMGGGPLSDELGAQGAYIGNYRIVRVIAAGGMGLVYEAQQAAPRRSVALKLLRRGFRSEAAIRRFRRESALLGRLSHAGVAHVFEAGVQDEAGESLPYFAMELLADALPLTTYANTEGLDTRQRVELLWNVCDAVEYCHRQGVIHRDLKPGNILVTRDGHPKVIDFGVARVLSDVTSDATWHTTGAPFIGSMPYMSPEQAALNPGAIDAQSDVYALGAILYELLAGRMALDVANLSPLEAARMIREDQPVRLGTVDRKLRGDLETIVATAMAKEKARRYRSAAALACDLQRFLHQQPIEARPPSRWYLVSLFARRHRALCGLVCATAAVLILATAISTTFALRAEHERGVARQAETAAVSQREAADYQAYVANIAAADAALRVHDVAEARRRLARSPERLRNWEWHFLQDRLDSSLMTLDGHEGIVGALAFSADGRWLATGAGGWGYSDSIVRVWDVLGGQLLKRLEGHGGAIGAVAFHPRQPHRLASGSNDDTVRLWDLGTDRIIATLPHTAHVGQLAYGADGEMLVSLDEAGTIRLWDAETGAAKGTFDATSRHECHCLALLPDGRGIACGGLDGAVRLLDAQTGRIVSTHAGHTASILTMGISQDGERIATGSEDTTIRIWNTRTWEERLTLRGHAAAVIAIAFAPGAELLASTSMDNTVRLWRVGGPGQAAQGEPRAVFHGHEASPHAVAFSPDGALLATGSADKTAKLWDLGRPEQPSLLRGHNEMVRTLTFSPDGHWIASGDLESSVRVWGVETGATVARLTVAANRVQAVAFHPTGRLLAAACDDGDVRLWDTRSWADVATLRADQHAAHALAFSLNGRLLASGGKESVVRVFDVDGGAMCHSVDLGSDWIETLAFQPAADRPLLAAGCRNGRVHIIDAPAGSRLQTFDPQAGGVVMLAWAPDRASLATGHLDGTVRILDAATGVELRRLVGHTAIVNAVAFSPDGTRLVSGANDTSARLWDVSTGDSLIALRAHTHWVISVAFSPDGTRIATGGGSYDGSDCDIRLWEAAPTRPPLEP